MSNTSPTDDRPTDASIAEKQQRLETIIAQLEDGEVSLDRANDLHIEGQNLIGELQQDLDLGNGKITERN